MRGVTVRQWHHCFSNFQVEPDGTHVEGEYQAEKHAGHPIRQYIILNSSPKVAKQLGRRWKLNRYQTIEWDHRKRQVMYELVKQKFEDHPEYGVVLTLFDYDIIEYNNWHDNYWGDCTCLRCPEPGENNLGQILMQLRDEFRA
jgi:ribA/ribD-fused uncharacterized protein